jgi:ABC-2 type transport system permease protein
MTRPGSVQTPAATAAPVPVVVSTGRREPRGPRRLGLWRLEWLRLVRTRRWVLLAVAYPGVGVVGPVFAKHRDEILKALRIDGVAPTTGMTADSGMAVYSYTAAQIGILVALALMASALAVDHRPGLAAFHRTRLRRPRDLVLPRFTVTTVAVSVAYLLGTLIAWAQVHWMFGPLPARSVLYGFGFGMASLITSLSVVAGTAALLRRPVAIFGASLVWLVAMPLATLWRPLRRWLPTELDEAPVGLLRGHRPSEYGDNLGVALVLSAALVSFAVWQIGRREM